MSALVLKLIAMVSMLVDHTACTLHVAGILQSGEFYTLLRGVGRLAFPIYGFQLVQGAVHTKNPLKYLLRLLLLAILSEVPFDLAIFGSWFTLRHQNVFMTLLLGLLAVFTIRYGSRMQNKMSGWGMAVCSTIACAAAAELLHTDYGAAGVCMIAVMGLSAAEIPKIREKITVKQAQMVTFALGVAVVTIFSSSSEALALADLLLIREYNGQRGYSGRWIQYGCYLFYPVHLLILGLLFIAPRL